MHHFYFPIEFIELNKEVSYHPDCIIKVMQATDFVQKNPFTLQIDMGDWLTAFCVKLMAICTYLNILVDGEYNEQQLRELADICTSRLKEQRREWRVDHSE
jgi:hypothetical protein